MNKPGPGRAGHEAPGHLGLGSLTGRKRFAGPRGEAGCGRTLVSVSSPSWPCTVWASLVILHSVGGLP